MREGGILATFAQTISAIASTAPRMELADGAPAATASVDDGAHRRLVKAALQFQVGG